MYPGKGIRRLAAPAALAALMAMSAPALAAPVLNPGNGHWYDAIAGAYTWTAAKAAAEASTFMGHNGHLVTITSAAEQAFVAGTFAATAVAGHYWLGASQAPGSPEPAGGWGWVTGEAFGPYTNWAGGEPNNAGGEDSMHFWPGGGTWNDVVNNNPVPQGFVVEYVVPAPSALLLCGIGLLGMFGIRRRRHTQAA